jgi:cytoskeletal protein RodZ
MESIGAQLKKIRLAKGLSLEETQKKTKLKLNVLQAIEEDSIAGINPIYLKGFLKIYCQFLGVDPKAFAAEQKGPHVPEKKVKAAAGAPPAEELPVGPAIKLEALSDFGKKARPFVLVALVFIFLAVLFSLGKFISSKRQPRLKEPKLPISASSIAKTSRAMSGVKPKPGQQALLKQGQHSPEAAAAKKEVLTSIRLGLRPREDCWVTVKVDGRLYFHGILKRGKYENWQAKEKIEFSLSNAGVVDAELNNKPLPALGRKGQPLKNIVITREGGLVVGR